MRVRRALAVALVAFAAGGTGTSAQEYDYGEYQDYGEPYGEDAVYEDFAMQKEAPAGGARFSLGQTALASAVSYVLGAKIHSSRLARRLKKKHEKDKKTMYTQYYNDVYALEEAKAAQQLLIDELQRSLTKAHEDHESENLEREYDEFKQPDLDGDDQISRSEFQMYVKDYLTNYPGLQEKDYPKFEDFDHDKDGYVSFTEYAKQMGEQARLAELEQMYAQSEGKSGRKEAQKANALYDLYSSSTGSDGFQDLYAQVRK